MNVSRPKYSGIVRLVALVACSALMVPSTTFAQNAPDKAEPAKKDPAATKDAPKTDVPKESEVIQKKDEASGDVKKDAKKPDNKKVEKKKAPALVKNEVTLESLFKAGLKHAAALKVEEAKQKHADWLKFRADYAWVPTIQSDTWLAPVPADTDPNNLGNNVDEFLSLNIGPFIRQRVRIVLPLYTFGRIAAAKRLAKINQSVTGLDYQKAKQDLFLQIQQAYHGLKLARAFGLLLRDGDKLVKKKLVEMEEAREFGDAKFKVKDFRKLQLFSADLDNRKLDNDKIIILAQAGLEYLTGEKVKLEQISPLDEKQKPAKLDTLAAYRALASANRPEIRQLNRALEARKAQVQLERTAYYPNFFMAVDVIFGWSNKSIARQKVCEVDASGACNFDTADARRFEVSPFGNPYNQFSVGALLGLQWNIDIAQTYGKVSAAEALLAQTMAQHSQAMGAIDLELKKLHLEASQARAKIEILGRRLKAAERWRNQLGLSAQNAGADLTDALEPLKEYYNTMVLYMQALYNYEIARAALAKGVGLDALPAVESAPKPTDGKVSEETTKKK